MNPVLKMLADVDPADVVSAEGDYLTSPRAMENLIIIGAMFVAIVIGTIFALLYRKKKKRKRHHHHHQHSASPAKDSKSRSESLQKGKRRRRRRERSNLPMNPTLAESGGLPPPRDDHHWPPGN